MAEIAVFVTVEVPEDKTEEFLKVMQIDVEGSRKEEGCIRFDLIKGEGLKCVNEIRTRASLYPCLSSLVLL